MDIHEKLGLQCVATNLLKSFNQEQVGWLISELCLQMACEGSQQIYTVTRPNAAILRRGEEEEQVVELFFSATMDPRYIDKLKKVARECLDDLHEGESRVLKTMERSQNPDA